MDDLLHAVFVNKICRTYICNDFGGALFLSTEKQLTTGDIWRKYVKRLMVVFCFWSAIYESFETLKTYSLSDHRYYLSFIKRFFEGHYHMWYIYMIVFLYIITPILRRIVEDKRLLQLFLLYAFFVWKLYSVALPYSLYR